MRAFPTSLLLVTTILACSPGGDAPEAQAEAPAAHGEVHPVLAAHTPEFEPRVVSVTPTVHVAVGYALANSILVEGESCSFVVDVTESVEAAQEIRGLFAERSAKPIGALVYTHNHADHVFGARGFVPEGEVPVYAHETTAAYIQRVVGIIRPIISMRSERMFGNHLPRSGPDRIENAGIGPVLTTGHGGGSVSLMLPTETFSDRLETEICGRPVHLVHAPGETNDQLFVWLPDEKVLLPGDNVYKAFPNLYTIRGTLYRDVLGWARSLDAMRALQPEHLAMSHTGPVSGQEEIDGILTAYRDAIQYVHDQTIRGMNEGLTPDELVERVVLPAHLASHPYLQELYGTVEWSVRSVFSGYLGWFDGDAATLSPAAPDERAEGYIELAGGSAALLEAARKAQAAGSHPFAAELASHLLRLEPGHAGARETKAAALRALGRAQVSPNGRNFYLTQARELEGSSEVTSSIEVSDSVVDVLRGIPIDNFLAAMPVNLDPAKSADVDFKAGFHFTDGGREFGIHVRRGVAEYMERLPDAPDLVVRTDTGTWKDLVTGRRNAAVVMATVELDGSRVDLVRFLSWFVPAT
ncbi:MAG: MBL fold metallo-hydrolase [Deltaproteobacteria bacterium]|jgi:alkyl sulfatase BDS1-like metallo-beta-lactamase superfamily hydrolase|nr:MBL fold metallo-hydrolase [Deltaproteobacteria bacterium]